MYRAGMFAAALLVGSMAVAQTSGSGSAGSGMGAGTSGAGQSSSTMGAAGGQSSSTGATRSGQSSTMGTSGSGQSGSVSSGAGTTTGSMGQSGSGMTTERSGKDQLSRSDKQFAEETAMSNRAELELSRIAADKASNPAVKQFAQQMIQDHTAASQQMMQIAKQKGLSLPQDMPEPDKKLRDKLNQASGNEVDMMYMKCMANAHAKDLSAFQLQAQTGKDPDLKQFASSQVPKLQDHMQHVHTILSQLGVTPPSSTTAMR